MLKCRIDVSDDALACAVRAVLALCGIVCTGDEGGILVTDSAEADVFAYSGCVMLTKSVNTTSDLPNVRVLPLPLDYSGFTEAVRAFEHGSNVEKQAPVSEKTQGSECCAVFRDGCVSFGEKSVQLTEREAALYELMASRRGETVTRDEIMNCVWSENDGTTNVADVYISYLRKKLIPLFGRGVIITVRGQGYMLVLPK